MRVLIDTNILLDVLQTRRPYDVAAARVWKLAEGGAIAGFVAAISFNNIFYVLRKQIQHADALAAVQAVRNSFGFVPLSEGVIDQALASTLNDLEDAIQAATAREVNADYIITRNVKDFAALGVTAITAEDLLAILQKP